MNIVLAAVNAKYIHSNLAVFSLAAYARRQGYAPEVLEFTINQRSDEILQAIYRARPDVLAFSVYIWNVRIVEELLEDLAVILPETEIWLGGPEVSYRAEEFLEKNPYVTGIMRGEGEKTFAALCGIWTGRPDSAGEDTAQPAQDCFCGIPGITWREGGSVRSTPDAAPVSLDELPFPYAGFTASGLPEHRIFYYESSRGCPFGCAYCLSSVEKSMRFRSMELVRRELRFFLDRKVQQVKFVDRTFNCSKKRSMEIWRFIRDHDNGVTNFHFEIGAELLDDDETALLRTLRPGQVQLECGIQSLNPETLSAVHRGMDFEKLAGNIRKLLDGGNIHIHLDLIAGLPYEDLDSFRKSFNGVFAFRPHQLQLGFLKVLCGSPMAADASGYGIEYRRTAPYEVVRTKWLSYDDIIRLKRIEEVFEIYYNSGQFRKTAELLLQEFPDPFSCFDALASFFEERGCFGISISRMQRFEMLLAFFMKLRGMAPALGDAPGVPAPEECCTGDASALPALREFCDAMVWDIYSRENLKNRPAFAAPLAPYAERIRAFYQKEARDPVILTGYEGCDWKQLRSMTHIEVFGREAVLFDYRRRDPVDHSAKRTAVALPEI